MYNYAVWLNPPDHAALLFPNPVSLWKEEALNLTTTKTANKQRELYVEPVITCISGSIPFPKMAARMDMEVNALKTLVNFEDSMEYSLGGASFDVPAGQMKLC